MTVFGVTLPALLGQLMLGLINGAFYAVLSLGLAVIFGLLNVVNFVHGALYMMGAFAAYLLLSVGGVPYWGALVLSPILVGLASMLLERLFIRRLYDVDHQYGFLLSFGMTLMLEGIFRKVFGASSLPYPNPLPGGVNTGFMFIPYYRAWALGASVVACFGVWYCVEKTRLGTYLRAAIQRPDLVRAFGVNVPGMLMLVYGLGAALAALAGVLAAPIYSVNPLMGSNLIVVLFAVVVVGGLGSIQGAVISGFALGVAEALTKVYYPPASDVVIFLLMVLVLLFKPQGLMGKRA